MKYLIDKLAYREVIKPEPINIPYIGNYHCHINCISYYKQNKEKVKAIVGGLQVFSDDNYTCWHFIIELQDDSFVDPTYGNMPELYSYIIPIESYKPENFVPNRELQYLKNYIHSLLPWYRRLFTKKTSM